MSQNTEVKGHWFMDKSWPVFTTLGVLILAGFFGCRACLHSIDQAGNTVDKISAEVASEQYVEGVLKSPSTAEFGSAEVIDFGNGEFKVKSYVDAENSFGAKIRSHYSCKVKFDKNANFTVSEFEME